MKIFVRPHIPEFWSFIYDAQAVDLNKRYGARDFRRGSTKFQVIFIDLEPSFALSLP